MNSKKSTFLFLAAVLCSGAGWASEPANGGAGAEPMVKLYISDDPSYLEVSRATLEHFEYFKSIFDNGTPVPYKEYKNSNEIHLYGDFDKELLKNLFSAIEGAQELSSVQKLDVLKLANYFLINDLGLQKIKLLLDANLYLDTPLDKIDDMSIGINLESEFSTTVDLKKVFNDVSIQDYTVWQPQGQFYLIKKGDQSAQMYQADGTPVGAPLDNMAEIVWQPQGQYYWIQFNTAKAQMYQLDGSRIGATFEQVADIKWQPQGQYYWIIFINGRAELHELGGIQVRAAAGVNDITWQPQGTHFWIHNVNSDATLFPLSSDVQIVKHTRVSGIFPQPGGNYYWVTTNDEVQSASLHQLRSNSTISVPINSSFMGVMHVNWQNDGKRFCIKYSDFADDVYDITDLAYQTPEGRVIRGKIYQGVYESEWAKESSANYTIFNNAYARIETPHNPEKNLGGVAKIHIEPQGNFYSTIFVTGETAIYDAAGRQIKKTLPNAHKLIWQPGGQNVLIKSAIMAREDGEDVVSTKASMYKIGKQILFNGQPIKSQIILHKLLTRARDFGIEADTHVKNKLLKLLNTMPIPLAPSQELVDEFGDLHLLMEEERLIQEPAPTETDLIPASTEEAPAAAAGTENEAEAEVDDSDVDGAASRPTKKLHY